MRINLLLKSILIVFSLIILGPMSTWATDADPYEVDDTFEQAGVIEVGGIAQNHNFHKSGDIDWLAFSANAHSVYEILISNVGPRADPVIELYYKDGVTLLEGPLSRAGAGGGERMEWACPSSGTYYLRIQQSDPGIFGEDTEYGIEVYKPSAIYPGFLYGSVVDQTTGTAISGALIETNDDTHANSLPDGNYLMVHMPGTFEATATAKGYQSKSHTGIFIEDGGRTLQNFGLTPLDSDNDGTPDLLDDDDDNDGMPDEWEETYGLDPLFDDAGGDPDDDDITNIEEYENGTNPKVSDIVPVDTDNDGIPDADDDDDDGDGMPDEWEETYGLNPLEDDAGGDPDNDDIINIEEYKKGTNPKVADIFPSPVETFVTRFYRLCLDRKPDPDGLNAWVASLIEGDLAGSDVAYGFVFSPEFLEKHTTDDEFLRILYEAFFNRQPDSAGRQGWLDALKKGASREDVLDGFIYAIEFADLCDEYGILAARDKTPDSPREYIEAFVTRFYRLCLGRDPDPPGLEMWTNNLLSQIQTGADVALGFLDSPEFLEKNTSHEDYLAILYKVFLNRNPDPAGLNAWLAELEAGRERGHIRNGFLYSKEFSELCQAYGIKPF